MTDPLGIDAASTAIVNVHWQHDVVMPDGAFGPFFAKSVQQADAIANALTALTAARAAGAFVLYARAAFRPGYSDLVQNCALYKQVASAQCLQEGSPGAEIIPALRPDSRDAIVTHARISAFQGTELDLMLRRRGVDTVLLTGVATNLTVEGTARDAVGLGYRTILVADACAAATVEAHQATLDTFQLLGEALTAADLESAFVRP